MSKIQVDDIVNKDDNGAPSFPYGAVVTGVVTATSLSVTDITATGNVSIAGTLTYEDVTNVDSIGIITARSDISIADKIIHTGDTDTAIRFPAADTFTVETSGSERLRITNIGDVGIGTTSPSTAITQFGGGAKGLAISQSQPVVALEDTSTSTYAYFGLSNNDLYIDNLGAGFTRFHTNGAERMRIDSSGNIGLGVIPNTHNLGKALEIGAEGNVLWGEGAGNIHLLSNAYYNGGYKYATSAPAGRYNIYQNTHIWARASSGTADAAATFTESMRIDGAGNIGIGTDNPTTKLDVAGDATFTGYVSANTAAGDWVATQAEAEAGTDNTKIMTPLRVKQAIDALGGSVINSIQRGVITTISANTNTATISAVDTSKTMVNHLGANANTSSSTVSDTTRLSLTNSTTITMDRQTTSGGSTTNYEVIEFV